MIGSNYKNTLMALLSYTLMVAIIFSLFLNYANAHAINNCIEGCGTGFTCNLDDNGCCLDKCKII